jgi:hypothetical protein
VLTAPTALRVNVWLAAAKESTRSPKSLVWWPWKASGPRRLSVAGGASVGLN